jgi:hypothetical protein
MSAFVRRSAVSLVVLWATAGFAARDCLAARIEAVAGKAYRLASQHGPWMVMVATFHSTGADGQTDEGKTPQQAADQLVLELRQQGVPAYTHEVENPAELFRTRDRLGQEVRRRNLRRVKSHCVLAGNYPSFDDDVAQKTLAWIKKFSPKSLTDGVSYRATPGRPLPLSGAFLCINPLRSASDVAAHRVDPLLKQLNSGVQHSLTTNRGPYTLVVAHFGGKQFTELRETRSPQQFLTDNDLDDAAENANQLAVALRQDLDPQRQFRNLDAYVWHDHDHSIVTVGSFQSEHDPAIAEYRKLFAAVMNPQTGRLEPRYLSIPGSVPKVWAFTPTLQVVRVPQLD